VLVGDNLHSQLVGWAKIILPFCALALLSTLFLFARDAREPDIAAFTRAEEIAREQRVTAPEFSGVTDNGDIIVISAKSVRPDNARADTVVIDEMRLRLDTPDRTFIEVTAVQGEVDGRAQIASFLGLAHLETSNGYELETNGLIAELETGRITSAGLLEIHAPFGELTAGMVTFQAATPQAGQQMLFTNGVRLLYKPETP
jgi:lipopolysaccharide export system protein LptC